MLFWCNREPGWVKGYIFAPSKNKTLKCRPKGKHDDLGQQLTLLGYMVLAHDCFNHYIGHAALLQSNER